MVHEWIHLRLPEKHCAKYLGDVVSLLSHRLPPLLYSWKDKEAPYQADLVFCHLERVRELAELYMESLFDLRPDFAIFFLEAYLWYRGVQYLDMTERLADRTVAEDQSWVLEMIYCAKFLQIILEYQEPGVYASQLDKSQVESAIEIFNRRGDLTPDEVKTLRPILQAVLAGAVRGLAMVFQHLNDCSFQIRGNFEALLDSNPSCIFENAMMGSGAVPGSRVFPLVKCHS